jgi:hypothetical protein
MAASTLTDLIASAANPQATKGNPVKVRRTDVGRTVHIAADMVRTVRTVTPLY